MNKVAVFRMFSMLLIVNILVVTFNTSVKASGTIYVEVDSNTVPQDAVPVVDMIIGTRRVKYWEHVINGVIQVKGDFILMHLDVESGEIIRYQKKWTEIKLTDIDFKTFEPMNIFWKKLVIFPNLDSCGYFYTFYNPRYPLVCWEVRYENGMTIMYDLDGNEVGYGVPAPTKGFSLSGYHNETYPDPWRSFRENADSWFKRWCTYTFSVSLPTPSMISSYVSDPDCQYFYEVAHGDSYAFTADMTGSCYYSSTAAIDMSHRPPMKFAFIGSCEGMTDTGPGTFSYEFRKGQMIDTVTIGYTGMASCPGWSVALPWQNYLFEKMNEGYTVKEAFDLACAEYPTIAPCVKFVGDVNLKVVRHDVAVVDVMPEYNFTYKGWWPVNINVTVVNEGNFSETVTLDLYYNITEGLKIGTQTFTLDVGETKTLTFAWNTADATPCRNYTITAKATIEFDSDLTDNILESQTKVKVSMLGDTNGDGVIDMRDVARLAIAFGSYPGHPKWDRFADINMDLKVDLRDIAIVARRFGKTCT